MIMKLQSRILAFGRELGSENHCEASAIWVAFGCYTLATLGEGREEGEENEEETTNSGLPHSTKWLAELLELGQHLRAMAHQEIPHN